MRFVLVLVLLGFLSGCAPAPAPAPVKPAAAPAAQSVPALAPRSFSPVQNLPSPAGLDAGFGGLPWGLSHADVAGLVLASEQPSLRSAAYADPNAPNMFLGQPVSKILYEFFEDAFYQVWIEFSGVAAYEGYVDRLVAAYGPPSESKPQKNYQAWFLPGVNVYCAYHDDDGTGDVSFWRQPIYLKKEALMRSVKATMRAAETDASTQEAGAADVPSEPVTSLDSLAAPAAPATPGAPITNGAQ